MDVLQTILSKEEKRKRNHYKLFGKYTVVSSREEYVKSIEHCIEVLGERLEADKKTKKRVKKIWNSISDKINMSPRLGVVSALYYVASREVGLSISEKRIYKVGGASDATIRKRKKELEGLYER